jgi:hypothetical protein
MVELLSEITETLMSALEDIAKIEALPRWARVALAARCARRVLPLLEAACEDQWLLLLANRAVTIAEEVATGPAPEIVTNGEKLGLEILTLADYVAESRLFNTDAPAIEISLEAIIIKNISEAISYALRSTAQTAKGIYSYIPLDLIVYTINKAILTDAFLQIYKDIEILYVKNNNENNENKFINKDLFDSFSRNIERIRNDSFEKFDIILLYKNLNNNYYSSFLVVDNIGKNMQADWNILRTAYQSQSWTDNTPVSPNFFGPFWPEGEPDYWQDGITKLQKRKQQIIVKKFNLLKRQWKEETRWISNISQLIGHPAYQEIVAMGDSALPLILEDLEQEPDFWFSALRQITGAEPVQAEDSGKMQVMAQRWLDWARREGIQWHHTTPSTSS